MSWLIISLQNSWTWWNRHHWSLTLLWDREVGYWCMTKHTSTLKGREPLSLHFNLGRFCVCSFCPAVYLFIPFLCIYLLPSLPFHAMINVHHASSYLPLFSFLWLRPHNFSPYSIKPRIPFPPASPTPNNILVISQYINHIV